MNDKVFLRNEFLYSVELNKINENLIDWDYSEVYGEACYKKYTGHFGFVKIKISKVEGEFPTHQLVNNLSEKELPIPFLNEITKSLNFFIAYLRGIKGERIELKIEIIDATYHIVDSRHTDFQVATFYAICNCFNKTLRKISEQELEVIENCKQRNKNYNF